MRFFEPFRASFQLNLPQLFRSLSSSTNWPL